MSRAHFLALHKKNMFTRAFFGNYLDEQGLFLARNFFRLSANPKTYAQNHCIKYVMISINNERKHKNNANKRAVLSRRKTGI